MIKVRIDLRDLKLLRKYKYRIHRQGYLIRNIRIDDRRTLSSLHRDITGAKKGETVDHIDGNPLNNSRKNLRICTQAENLRNQKKYKNNTSGFKGVSYCEWRSHLDTPWMAQIGIDGKLKYLRCFPTAKEAARAYDKKAKELFGEFAQLNFKENV